MDHFPPDSNKNHGESTNTGERWITGCRSIAIATGGFVLAAAGIFLSLYGVNATRDETRDEYDAGVATAHDNLPADIVSIDGNHGRATVMIIQGDAVKCYIDNVGFGVIRTRHGYISDVGGYTITIINSKERGGTQTAIFENRDELAKLLGPDPCNPPEGGPAASGLRR